MAEQGERSAQEREAARLEREARRAQRRPEPDVEEPSASDDGAEPAELDGHHETTPTPALVEPDEELAGDEHVEVPLGTRRATHLDRARTQGRRRDRSPAARRRRVRPAAGGRRPWVGRALSVVALAVGVVVIWFLVELFQPFHGSAQGAVTVTIAPHSSSSQIGDQLERDGVIASSFFFNLRATLAGDRGSMLAGTYQLQHDMSYGDVLRALTTPPVAAKTTSVTVIEGRTRAQIDALLRSQGVSGSYLSQTRRSALLDPRSYGAPAGTPSLEGFLFPSTYQLIAPLRISALVADQLRTFRQEFSHVDLRFARSKRLTPYDVLIIASIVEKEAGTARDFPLVASVIYNRLAMHMPLGMDSTIRYEFNDYAKPLTDSQLNAPSPYNTRLRLGLTPTPIANPGLAAIDAAAHPAGTSYLYFVAKVCGKGASVFTASYTQFLNYVAQYQAARARNGGRSPTRC